jgi:DNA-binding response OmpR family regulator
MVIKRVLVIDDEEDIREVAQASLELIAGLEVLLASSSREGLTIADLEQPDAILLDVMLPDMDGIAVFQELRSNPNTKHIPVIFLTARTRLTDRQKFAQLGAHFITKPFKPRQLANQFFTALNW